MRPLSRAAVQSLQPLAAVLCFYLLLSVRCSSPAARTQAVPPRPQRQSTQSPLAVARESSRSRQQQQHQHQHQQQVPLFNVSRNFRWSLVRAKRQEWTQSRVRSFQSELSHRPSSTLATFSGGVGEDGVCGGGGCKLAPILSKGQQQQQQQQRRRREDVEVEGVRVFEVRLGDQTRQHPATERESMVKWQQLEAAKHQAAQREAAAHKLSTCTRTVFPRRGTVHPESVGNVRHAMTFDTDGGGYSAESVDDDEVVDDGADVGLGKGGQKNDKKSLEPAEKLAQRWRAVLASAGVNRHDLGDGHPDPRVTASLHDRVRHLRHASSRKSARDARRNRIGNPVEQLAPRTRRWTKPGDDGSPQPVEMASSVTRLSNSTTVIKAPSTYRPRPRKRSANDLEVKSFRPSRATSGVMTSYARGGDSPKSRGPSTSEAGEITSLNPSGFGNAVYFSGLEVLVLKSSPHVAPWRELPRASFSVELWVQPEGGQNTPAVIVGKCVSHLLYHQNV
ncbi:hypothetical protein C0Q70_17878 [Pomacea canaliculata]|uniref:Uncharacterized protein n=1 Tax=Pomacea canaliculata TaxID=400727 RepID=A0A2T7NLN9_POMCA|nr:hypothetical protein C0Q70_17878 [Pomacea canaliculata]